MNFSKNYTLRLLFTRTACYIIYLIVSAFMGKIAVLILSPPSRYFVNEYNAWIFELIWYIINLLVMYAAMTFFVSRDGFADTDRRRYSILRNCFALSCAALLFYGILSFFYFFPQFSHFAYIISVYFSYGSVWNFVPDFIIPLFLIYTFVILAAGIGLGLVGYSLGRKRWIANQKKKIARIAAEKAAKEHSDQIARLRRR